MSIFKYNDIEIKTTMINNEIFFQGKNICDILGIKNNREAIRKIPEHWKIKNVSQNDTNRMSTYINESGLYKLIMRSDKEEAIAFQDFVYSEILPQIRKTGKYELDYKLTPKIPFLKLQFKIENEFDLHSKIVNYIRCRYSDVVMIAQIGELQDTSDKRIKSYEVGYNGGAPDLIINELSGKYNGLCIEFKSPSGRGILLDKQNYTLQQYEARKYKTVVSNNYDEILLEVYDYMLNKRLPCRMCPRRFKHIETLNTHHRKFHKIDL